MTFCRRRHRHRHHHSPLSVAVSLPTLETPSFFFSFSIFSPCLFTINILRSLNCRAAPQSHHRGPPISPLWCLLITTTTAAAQLVLFELILPQQ
ncbi:uncharacterized protein DS421_16g551290 [Arachis hypogaea]|nr:uncharacterized protein DS421_16g551290 [Arachis hypogaea]